MLTTMASMARADKGLLDRRIFVDPDIYKQELEQVFGRCWLYLGHESQVDKPNDFLGTYMGEDPVLLTRDSKGKLHGFLNMCRHRGNRISRADFGNCPSFMCTYHGWTFTTDGKLVGVPGYKEAYFEELDRSQWGLVETAQIESYKGLVFATWDRQAPPLIKYLGGMSFELDFLVGRHDSPTQVLSGVNRWALNANWKYPADNFGGDDGHHAITHGSVRHLDSDRAYSSSFAGRGGLQARNELRDPLENFKRGPIRDYYRSHVEEAKKRLGLKENDPRGYAGSVGTVFPNTSIHCVRHSIRTWHPRGPTKTEIWSYCIVDKDAPDEVKNAMKTYLTGSFSPGGVLEQDDMNNWLQSTSTAMSPTAQKYVQGILAGLGHDSEKFTIGTKLRQIYARWANMMDAPSWSEVKLDWRYGRE
ncbi:MAG: aromatic ring-hydroxylating dioxygenase subunit alpha [Dehalococcoidia bacterium]|nr:aromatic ring-hydroxylating dioxygenase subunit alpha [Dehalococcoidia bacterium]